MQRTEEPPLTSDELTRLQQFAKDGIHLTPEMLRNITPEFVISPIINTIADSMIESLGVIVKKEGRLFPLIEVRNPILEHVGMKKENVDFMKVWEQKNMKLSLNMKEGFLSFATHGLNPYIKQELRDYDIEDLFCILAAKIIREREKFRTSGRPWKKGKIPKRMGFTKKERKRILVIYKELAAIEKAKRKRERISAYSGLIYG
jgi:hypothetical protein